MKQTFVPAKTSRGGNISLVKFLPDFQYLPLKRALAYFQAHELPTHIAHSSTV